MKTFFHWVIQLISCNLYKLNEIVNEQTIKQMKLELLWFFLAWPHERSHWLKKRGRRKKGHIELFKQKQNKNKKIAWKMELGFDFCAETLNPVTPKQVQGNERLKIVKNSYIQEGLSTLLTSAASLHPQPPVVPGTLQHQRWQNILHLPNMMRPDFQVGCK